MDLDDDMMVQSGSWPIYDMQNILIYMGSQAPKTNRIYALGDMLHSTAMGISTSIRILDFFLDSDDDMMVQSGSWPIYDMQDILIYMGSQALKTNRIYA